jgi:DNA polymerase V
VIARSNEAKKLGVAMVAPCYQYQSLCKKHHIYIFSSNYTLYGDMAARVMDIMGQNVPALETYSIDEAFLKLSQADINFAAWLRQHIKQCTGLPVSIGLGSSKSLAKIANFIAKKEKAGIFDLTDPELRNAILANFPIEEIWGIGRLLALRLKKLGVFF